MSLLPSALTYDNVATLIFDDPVEAEYSTVPFCSVPVSIQAVYSNSNSLHISEPGLEFAQTVNDVRPAVVVDVVLVVDVVVLVVDVVDVVVVTPGHGSSNIEAPTLLIRCTHDPSE
jgi:hypothetical protein